jgi:CheY-like chemotaxis protein
MVIANVKAGFPPLPVETAEGISLYPDNSGGDPAVTTKTILVIEDNEMNMKLMRAVLQLGPYRMLEAVDAETGLELARKEHPDLVLMDIQLPGMDGLSATRIIKSDQELKRIPVIAITGFAMDADKENARDIGFETYVVKPFNVKTLLDTIDNTLRSGRSGT